MKSVKAKVAAALLCLLPFAVLYILAKLFFRDVYLFEWMLRHRYVYLWAAAGLIALFRAKWGYVIAYGNLIAVIVGQTAGTLIKNHNLTKITPDTPAWQEAHLREHPGFAIWLCLLLAIIVLYALIRKLQKRRAARLQGSDISPAAE